MGRGITVDHVLSLGNFMQQQPAAKERMLCSNDAPLDSISSLFDEFEQMQGRTLDLAQLALEQKRQRLTQTQTLPGYAGSIADSPGCTHQEDGPACPLLRRVFVPAASRATPLTHHGAAPQHPPTLPPPPLVSSCRGASPPSRPSRIQSPRLQVMRPPMIDGHPAGAPLLSFRHARTDSSASSASATTTETRAPVAGGKGMEIPMLKAQQLVAQMMLRQCGSSRRDASSGSSSVSATHRSPTRSPGRCTLAPSGAHCFYLPSLSRSSSGSGNVPCPGLRRSTSGSGSVTHRTRPGQQGQEVPSGLGSISSLNVSRMSRGNSTSSDVSNRTHRRTYSGRSDGSASTVGGWSKGAGTSLCPFPEPECGSCSSGSRCSPRQEAPCVLDRASDEAEPCKSSKASRLVPLNGSMRNFPSSYPGQRQSPRQHPYHSPSNMLAAVGIRSSASSTSELQMALVESGCSQITTASDADAKLQEQQQQQQQAQLQQAQLQLPEPTFDEENEGESEEARALPECQHDVDFCQLLFSALARTDLGCSTSCSLECIAPGADAASPSHALPHVFES